MLNDVKGVVLGRHSKIEKYTVPVRVHFSNGTEKFGLAFLRNDQRLIDLLCDARPFFPMQTKDKLTFVSKANVLTVELLQRDDYEAKQDLFPPLDWDPLEEKVW